MQSRCYWQFLTERQKVNHGDSTAAHTVWRHCTTVKLLGNREQSVSTALRTLVHTLSANELPLYQHISIVPICFGIETVTPGH